MVAVWMVNARLITNIAGTTASQPVALDTPSPEDKPEEPTQDPAPEIASDLDPPVVQESDSTTGFAYSDEFRDPFLPWGAPKPTRGRRERKFSLVLKGILWDERGPLAVIEDARRMAYVVGADDQLGDDAVVISIDSTSVKIKERDRVHRVRVWEEP
jgi:hypothetical protein